MNARTSGHAPVLRRRPTARLRLIVDPRFRVHLMRGIPERCLAEVSTTRGSIAAPRPTRAANHRPRPLAIAPSSARAGALEPLPASPAATTPPSQRPSISPPRQNRGQHRGRHLCAQLGRLSPAEPAVSWSCPQIDIAPIDLLSRFEWRARAWALPSLGWLRSVWLPHRLALRAQTWGADR